MVRILWSNQTISHQFFHVFIYLLVYAFYNCLIAVGIIQRGVYPVTEFEVEVVTYLTGKVNPINPPAAFFFEPRDERFPLRTFGSVYQPMGKLLRLWVKILLVKNKSAKELPINLKAKCYR